MSKVLAIIVSFHPEQDVLTNVEVLLKQVDHIVIVDNETSDHSKGLLSKIADRGVTLIPNLKNLGVAKGFNQGLQWGLENNYEYFLLMDQDSRLKESMVQILMSALADKMPSNPLSIVGPHHEDFERSLQHQYSDRIIFEPLLITSGSLIPRTVLDAIGLYDERLFIDHVDHDFCLRLAKAGGLSFKVNDAVLLHRFGQAEIRKFLGKSFFLQSYSPIRRYHMMRNRIVLYRRYGMFGGEWFYRDLRSAIVDFIKLVFFEERKTVKLKSVFRGFIDGVLWKD